MNLLDNKNVLLGVTGGIAAYKAAFLARELGRAGARVQAVLTKSAREFITGLTFEILTEQPCWVDEDMFVGLSRKNHIQLAKNRDLIVIAPATATTLARLATGMADNLLSATVLASTCPVVISPAMHTQMWESAAVQRNVSILKTDPRFVVVPPDQGELASGDIGPGRLPDTDRIIEYCKAALTPATLSGRTVVISAGPTIEHIDPVRIVTNPSSGEMGMELARAAGRRGAAVRLVLGPCALEPDRLAPGASWQVTRIETTLEMLEALRLATDGADGLAMAAAPADERPAVKSDKKIPKGDFTDSIVFEHNPDILASLAPITKHMAVLSFAAETEISTKAAIDKMNRKGADLLFANQVGPGKGFGTVNNGGLLVAADETPPVRIPEMPKRELAEVLMEHLAALINEKVDR